MTEIMTKRKIEDIAVDIHNLPMKYSDFNIGLIICFCFLIIAKTVLYTFNNFIYINNPQENEKYKEIRLYRSILQKYIYGEKLTG